MADQSALTTSEDADGSNNNALAALEGQGIVYRADLGLFICTNAECGCEVKGKRSEFMRHLKGKGHEIASRAEAERVWVGAKRRMEEADGDAGTDRAAIERERKKYREGGWSVGVLPLLPDFLL